MTSSGLPAATASAARTSIVDSPVVRTLACRCEQSKSREEGRASASVAMRAATADFFCPGSSLAPFGWIASFTRSRRSTGAAISSSMICASSAPVMASISARWVCASLMNSGSFNVRSKARRSAATRSGGTPGVVAIGRPTTVAFDMNSSTACSSGVFAFCSRSSGTSGRSGSFSMPTWMIGMIHFFCDVFRRDRDVARPRIGRAPFDLAALHREVDVAAVRIAEDDPDPGAEDVVVDRRHLHRDRSGLGRADGGLALDEVGPASWSARCARSPSPGSTSSCCRPSGSRAGPPGSSGSGRAPGRPAGPG